MGRKKIRNYPTIEDWEDKISEYLKENKERYRKLILDSLGYDDFDSLIEDEYKMKFGGDCGWVSLVPLNKEMAREWRLDNDGLPNRIFDIASVVYNTQSITIKSIVIEKLIEDMGLEKDFYMTERLD